MREVCCGAGATKDLRSFMNQKNYISPHGFVVRIAD
jgi:hypothetical protein